MLDYDPPSLVPGSEHFMLRIGWPKPRRNYCFEISYSRNFIPQAGVQNLNIKEQVQGLQTVDSTVAYEYLLAHRYIIQRFRPVVIDHEPGSRGVLITEALRSFRIPRHILEDIYSSLVSRSFTTSSYFALQFIVLFYISV